MRSLPEQRRRRVVGSALLGLTATAGLAWPDVADAGTIGWAEAVNMFADEGVAVGAAAVVLGIMAVGAILMFGITGLVTTVVMVCLGGALMANATDIASTAFAGGGVGGGGSIYDTTAAESGSHALNSALRRGAPLVVTDA